MTIYFKNQKKKKKIMYFEAIVCPFYPNLDKDECSLKKYLCQFLNISVIYHRAENQKTLSPIPEKNVEMADGQTDRRTDNVVLYDSL